MIKRLFCFGDSFTEGEGAWVEKTFPIQEEYKNKDSSRGAAIISEINYEYSWPKQLGDLFGLDTSKPLDEEGHFINPPEFTNFGSCGASNNYIFNEVFKADLQKKFTEDDLVIIMWSSTMRDKLPFFPNLFQDKGPVGLGWSLKEVLSFNAVADKDSSSVQVQRNFSQRYNFDDLPKHERNYLINTITPFMHDYFKPFISEVHDTGYYNIINYSYIHLLQSYLKARKCKYIFIDAFENMTDFNPGYKKWDNIDPKNYWSFKTNTAWGYLDGIGGDVFENTKLTYNPVGQRCHPNRHGYKLIAKLLYDFYSKSLST